MIHIPITFRRALGTLLWALLPCASTSSQEPARGAAPAPPRPEPPAQDLASLQEEMKRLFGEVEHNLRRIDRLLSDAAAGDVPLSNPGESGLDKLLRHGQERGQRVVLDIDRILQIAQQMSSNQHSRSSGKQGKPDPGQGQSPLDKPQGRSQPENTPQQPAAQEPGGQQPEDGRQVDDSAPRNLPPATPPGDKLPGEPARPADAKDTWGDLPERAQAVFSAQGGGDMPVQYRGWIDSYYKRLNQRRQ